jgi:exodeoxyribonuclease VII small subunit
MSKKKTDIPDFEAAMQALETIVGQMEKGDLSLEQQLQMYEQGMVLSRQCEQALKAAEQRVQVLTQKDGEARLEPFEPEAA